ncbi:hypothetical protein F5Y12DRAFT_709719 [Xylaria sp. FL1777]|nr:hypothetical protein F5Y12DRAFT_709719 [Xylaria sp. FL1777]
MRTSFMTAIAALAASAVSTPIEDRSLATWTATNVTSLVAHIILGARFTLNVPAGYIDGAPGFNVFCAADLVTHQGLQTCTGAPAGSTVQATFSITPPITVYHTFGSTNVTAESGTLGYNTDFTLDVTKVATV